MANDNNMVTLTIDGQQVTVPRGTKVVDAARSLGIEIPTFCWHPKLKPAGSCRICYVEIEKARFGEKLNVVYNVDEDIAIKIPSLIIQPIVENSIKHGILKGTGKGTVKINIKKLEENKVKITIQDDGIGISEEIIEKVYEGKTEENKIGISNVHNRLKCIYGNGLKIERLIKGTRTSFIVYDLKE